MFEQLAVLCGVIALVRGKPAVLETDQLRITLLHVNDIHAHFEQVNVHTGTCKPGGECYGGAARLAGYVRRVRDQDPQAILLNAGDFYQVNSEYRTCGI